MPFKMQRTKVLPPVVLRNLPEPTDQAIAVCPLLVDWSKVRGVVQVGAGYGEEVWLWHAAGVKNLILVEPRVEGMAGVQRAVQAKYGIDPGLFVKYIQAAADAEDGYAPFHLTREPTASSLALPLLHARYAPDASKVIQTDSVPTFRLDTVFGPKADPKLAERFNLLYVDVQGCEHRVLGGAAGCLDRFDWIVLEANDNESYVGTLHIDRISEALCAAGYIEMMVRIGGACWGDAVFARPSVILPTNDAIARMRAAGGVWAGVDFEEKTEAPAGTWPMPDPWRVRGRA